MADSSAPEGSSDVDDPPTVPNGGRSERTRTAALAPYHGHPDAALAAHDEAAPTTYGQILATLPPHERRMVHDAVTSGLLEGYVPDLKSVAHLADLAVGKITGEQYRARLLESIGSHSGQCGTTET